MAKVEYTYRGLMTPVFTPFNDDRKRSINFSQVEPYAELLKRKGVPAVLICGTSGEGVTLTVDERKVLAETWLAACKKHDLRMMLQIGGGPFAHVAELAAHAESIKVEAILCLPELYFKPKTEEDLVKYLKSVSEYCPNTPILYYNIPMFTSVTLNMPKFCDLAEKEILNFAGIKHSSADLDQGSSCLKPGRVVFLGSPKVLIGAIALGFDSAILAVSTIYPELPAKIFELMAANKLNEARDVQQKLSRKTDEILNKGPRVPAMKYAANQAHPNLKLGPPRLPHNPIAF